MSWSPVEMNTMAKLMEYWRDVTEHDIHLWLEAFAGDDPAEVTKSLVVWKNTQKFRPKIEDIRRMLPKAGDGARPGARTEAPDSDIYRRQLGEQVKGMGDAAVVIMWNALMLKKARRMMEMITPGYARHFSHSCAMSLYGLRKDEEPVEFMARCQRAGDALIAIYGGDDKPLEVIRREVMDLIDDFAGVEVPL